MVKLCPQASLITSVFIHFIPAPTTPPTHFPRHCFPLRRPHPSPPNTIRILLVQKTTTVILGQRHPEFLFHMHLMQSRRPIHSFLRPQLLLRHFQSLAADSIFGSRWKRPLNILGKVSSGVRVDSREGGTLRAT